MAKTPRNWFTIIAFIVAFSAIGGYALLQAHNLLLGPMLTVSEPRDGSSISSTTPLVLVSGHVKNISSLTLNGSKIFTESDGRFARNIALNIGYNVVTLEARDKFDKVVKKSLQLIYQ